MESLQNQSPVDDICSQLLTNSLNFHGQELLTALQVEHPDIVARFVDTRCLHYVEYQKRAPQAEFHLRSKRQQLLHFTARKAHLLFRPISKKMESPEENEEMFAVLPPIEKYMSVPHAERKSRFLDYLCKGDIIIGVVRSWPHPTPGSPRCKSIMNVICFDKKKKRYIDDLLIKAELAHGEYNAKDLIRGTVSLYNPSTGKIIITVQPNSDFPGNIKLGKIGNDELPRHYLATTEDLNYETALENNASFKNPQGLPNLCAIFDLELGGCCTSLMENLSLSNYPRTDYATELRKKQMSHWAMRSLREGEKCNKEEEEMPSAIQSANTALDMDPQNAEAFVQRGALFVSREEFEKAIEDFKMALTYDPENRNAKKFLSDAYMMLGQKYAGLADINMSYEFFRLAVDYNSANKEAVQYLNAIVSVKVLEDAERSARENAADDDERPPLITSPKVSEVSASPATATQSWLSTSAESLHSGGASWFTPVWSGTSVAYGPPASWQNTASSWTASSSTWHDTSSVWPGMSGTWSSVGVPSAFPVVAPTAPFPVHNSEEELPSNKTGSVEVPNPDELDQLNYMIEIAKNQHVLEPFKRHHSTSTSSSSSTSSSKKKKNSSHRKKCRYKEESSDGEISSHSSASSAVDHHKQQCEEFLERNRRQMEKNQSQSRDTKRVPVLKDIKEDGSSKKDQHHRKSDHVHKKDCLKKINKICSKDCEKNLNKLTKKDKKQDSAISKKDQKNSDSTSHKKDTKRNEKVLVEVSHLESSDHEERDCGIMYDSRYDKTAVSSHMPSTPPESVKATVLCSAAQDFMDPEPKRQKVFFVFKKERNSVGKRSATKCFEDKTVAQYFGENSEDEETLDDTDVDIQTNMNHEVVDGIFKNSSASFHRRNYRSQHDDDLSEPESSKMVTEATKDSRTSYKLKVDSSKEEKNREKASNYRPSHHHKYRHYCSKHSSQTRHRDNRGHANQGHYSSRKRPSDSEEDHHHSRRHKDYTDYRDKKYY